MRRSLSCLECAARRTRAGMGTTLADIYAAIAQDAGSGSVTLGEISGALLNLGLTVEAVRNALGVVANNVGSNPQQLLAIQAELNYLNTYGTTPNRGNQWVWIVIGLGALYVISRD